ncbi:MAG TPA: hypothetical protein VI389_10435 [Geobacteraceae bacterium]
MDDKSKQEISLIGRLFSIEALLLLMGLASLISGFITLQATQIFWGVMIAGGAVVLHFVRKKDWKKHWEEQEMLRQAYEERRKREKEQGDK